MYNGFLRNSFFKTSEQKIAAEIDYFLNHINIPKFSEGKAKLCEEDLSEKDLYDFLKGLRSDKPPGNGGLTKKLWNILE